MQYAMFLVMRDIRGLTVPKLAEYLYGYLKDVNETFDSNNDLLVHQQNRNQLHKLLARITDYVEVGSGWRVDLRGTNRCDEGALRGRTHLG
jgi:hypothetical protein